ncbi:MAG TPA: DUF2934 domain-containing protein [Blastocatellia bacterium]|nr:DUF2934 domain-containing protein [Blastocatellia bacterium]
MPRIKSQPAISTDQPGQTQPLNQPIQTDEASGTETSNDSMSTTAGADVQDRISQRAYELYQQRINEGRDGCDLDDWLCAESEIRGSGSSQLAS